MVMNDSFGEKKWLANSKSVNMRITQFYKIRDDLTKDVKYLEENNIEEKNIETLNQIEKILLDAENETITQIVGIQDKTNHYGNKDNFEKDQNEKGQFDENPEKYKKKKCIIF